jgi:hypoxanthine-guanine phosphoribosyltransferase
MTLSETLKRVRAVVGERPDRQEALIVAVIFADAPDVKPERMHQVWCATMMSNGFQYGFTFDHRTDPRLLPYDQLLPQDKKRYDDIIEIVKSKF